MTGNPSCSLTYRLQLLLIDKTPRPFYLISEMGNVALIK